MKLRTFLATLLICLIILFGGINIVLYFSFEASLGQVKETSAAAHYQIASSLYEDLSSLNQRGTPIEDALSQLLTNYDYMTQNNETLIGISKDARFVNTIGSFEFGLGFPQAVDTNQVLNIQKHGDTNYVFVNGKLPAPFDEYSVQYRTAMPDIIYNWKQTRNALIGFGLGLSFLIMLALLFILDRIFSPLAKISEISGEIAGGNYEIRLPTTGKDELATMEQSFNHMADQIENQVATLRQLNENQQQFIDSFAHELRTPLTAIYGYAEYLQRAAVNEEEQFESLETIMSESNRIQGMAAQLLELADMRKREIKIDKIEISHLFSELKRVLKSVAEKRGVTLEFIDRAPYIFGEYDLIFRLLINLIENAMKACDRLGHVAIVSDSDNIGTTLSVSDNGRGMPADALDYITEPYYRTDSARNHKNGGAGLGLSICSKIAEVHGTKLVFSSELGKGTTVQVIFTTP